MSFTYIQCCRGIAAMLVVLIHLSGSFASPKYFNDPRFYNVVDIGLSRMEFFFVLSGFVITFVHLRDIGQPGKAGNFLWRRASRVFPPYWIILLTVAAGLALVPALREHLPHSAADWVKCLLLIPQDPAIEGGTGAPVLVAAWTLHYEIVFYALFTLLILDLKWGLGAAAAFVGWWVLATLWPAFPRFPLDFLRPHFFICFAFGIVIGFVTRRIVIPHPWLWAAAGLALYLAMAVVREQHWLASKGAPLAIGYALASALIIVGLARAEQGAQLKAPRFLVKVGDASYVLYLLHFPLVIVLVKLAMKGPHGAVWQALDFALIFAICCGAALAFHRWIELPIVAALKPKRVAPPAAQTAT